MIESLVEQIESRFAELSRAMSDPEVIGETLHVLLKYQSDITKARKELQVPDGSTV